MNTQPNNTVAASGATVDRGQALAAVDALNVADQMVAAAASMVGAQSDLDQIDAVLQGAGEKIAVGVKAIEALIADATNDRLSAAATMGPADAAGSSEDGLRYHIEDAASQTTDDLLSRAIDRLNLADALELAVRELGGGQYHHERDAVLQALGQEVRAAIELVDQVRGRLA